MAEAVPGEFGDAGDGADKALVSNGISTRRAFEDCPIWLNASTYRVDEAQPGHQRHPVAAEPLDRPLIALRHRAHAARDDAEDDEYHREQEDKTVMAVPP